MTAPDTLVDGTYLSGASDVRCPDSTWDWSDETTSPEIFDLVRALYEPEVTA